MENSIGNLNAEKTYVQEERFGLFGDHTLWFGLWIKSMFSGQIFDYWQVFGHLDRLTVIGLVDDVRQVRKEQTWN